MSAMTPLRVAALAALLAPAPLLAVGLGPLTKEGVVAGPRKAFYLTVVNPGSTPTNFVTSAIGLLDEQSVGRVAVFPSTIRLGGYQNRQILVIAGDLQPGETFRFRVCAERAQPPEGATIHARVCSKLSARRLAGAGMGGGG